jgi:pyruvate dehydrogenase E2 component (dihydrolipoamide acetyltransferase)
LAQSEVRIPDIGDADDVEVIEIFVESGAQVAVDDPLIVIESDKASMEVPTTAAGRVQKIMVNVGDKVHEGQVIAIVESAEVQAAAPSAPTKTATTNRAAEVPHEAPPKVAPVKPAPAKAKLKEVTAPASPLRRIEVRVPDIGDAKDVVVVEVSVKAGQTVAVDDLLMVVESDKASMEIPAPVAGRIVSVDVEPGTGVNEGTLLVVIETAAGLALPVPDAGSVTAAEGERAPASAVTAPTEKAAPRSEPLPPANEPDRGAIYAGPAVRRIARELGVDLQSVVGTGPHSRILKSDVHTFVKTHLAAPRSASAGALPTVPAIDFTKFGTTETVPLSRIRARGAENLHRSWLNVVHVTQHDDADITDLEVFRGELKADAQARDIKLTPLAFIVKAVIATLQSFPNFNASLDPTIQNLIVKRYFNIGFAVDTPEGLVVPVLRDADRLGVLELAKQIELLSAKAQSGKLAINELQGGSFSVSSLGGIGGLGFTPIVNAPEVAILGVSRLTMKPQWDGNAFVARQMLPLSLSYDHRAINGAEAGRFLTSLCQTLKDIRRILL